MRFGEQRGVQEALAVQAAEALLVGLRVGATGLAGSEALGAGVLIVGLDDAVDPAKAEGLFDGVVVSNAGLAGGLLGIEEPDLRLGLEMGNNVYPARAGEVLRAAVLKRREGVSISASLATIIVERIFDGVVMLAFIFLNLRELAGLTGGAGLAGGLSIQQIAFWGTLAFGAALLLFLLGAMFPQASMRVLEWGAGLAPQRFRDRLLDIGRRFLDGLASLRSPLDALMVFLTSLVIWLLETGKYWFVMQAFDFEVSFFALMLMNGVVNLATTIPSAPGYIGTFDAPGIAVLVAYGVRQSIATSYTFILHVALWLPITLLGAYYLAREGIRWGQVPDIEEASP